MSAPEKPKDAPLVSPRYLGVVRRLSDLRVPLRQRCAEIQLTRTKLDARAGLADGYSSKLIAGIKGFGPISLPLILEVTGVVLLAVVDDEAVAAIERELGPGQPASK